MNRKLIALIASGLYALALTAPASAGGDAQAGRSKSAPCHACHGETGHGSGPIYPKLAGQYQSYLAKALQDYRDGTRDNLVMSPFAASLSDQDIDDLAAWFSSQQGLKVLD